MVQNVAVVTGASRGVGRGIAHALGMRGFTVYVTGRGSDALEASAEEVTVAGGRGVAVACDHAVDAQVEALFDRVRADSGRLDILVNNAWKVNVRDLSSPAPLP